eukprot:gb/GECG01004685.1/.p1 GENE.gb/GECG01004685.1/~~gb/GECG01004685.1/.p1  ORF type:complete len:314 (+),score=65.55 gb/GECG01004685.1/:1-942(+)
MTSVFDEEQPGEFPDEEEPFSAFGEHRSSNGGSFGGGASQLAHDDFAEGGDGGGMVMSTREQLVLINNFIATSADFLNRLGVTAEHRLQQLSERISRLNTELVVLENKLDKIAGLEGVNETDIAEGVPDSAPAPQQQQHQPQQQAVDHDPNTIEVKNHVDYGYYFGLLWNEGMPTEHVKYKMENAGLNSSLLDTPDHRIPRQSGRAANGDPSPQEQPYADAQQNGQQDVAAHDSSAESNVMKIKDDPEYSTFFKMRKVGIDDEAIKQKMVFQGVDPSLLDRGDEPSPNQQALVPRDDDDEQDDENDEELSVAG